MKAHIAKIEIEDATYVIRANMGALSEIQEAFKLKSIDEIGTVFDGSVDINKFITFMEILLRAGGNENSEDLAKKCEMPAIMEAFNHLGAAMGQNENPKKARPKSKRASRSHGKKR